MIETTIVFYPMVDIKTNKQVNVTSYLGYKRSILFSKKSSLSMQTKRYKDLILTTMQASDLILSELCILLTNKVLQVVNIYIYISSPVFIITQLLKLHNLLGAFHLLEKIEEDKAYFLQCRFIRLGFQWINEFEQPISDWINLDVW